jgi:hypothetical protein
VIIITIIGYFRETSRGTDETQWEGYEGDWICYLNCVDMLWLSRFYICYLLSSYSALTLTMFQANWICSFQNSWIITYDLGTRKLLSWECYFPRH